MRIPGQPKARNLFTALILIGASGCVNLPAEDAASPTPVATAPAGRIPTPTPTLAVPPPAATPTPTPLVAPTPTRAPTPTPTSAPLPTATPAPTRTPTPSPTPGAGGSGVQSLVYSSGSTPGGYGYAEYLPAGYSSGSNYPIVFFLHGTGEKGDGSPAQLSRVLGAGPPSYVAAGTNYPFILISPQTNGSWSAYEAQYNLDPFVDYILAKYKVDRKRVYMTGLSLGGSGTWAYGSFAPQKLAAILPVCGGDWGYNQPAANAFVAQRVAIWTFHGTNDGSTGVMTDDQWMSMIGYTLGAKAYITDSYPASAVGAYSATYSAPSTSWVWKQGQTPRDLDGTAADYPYIYTRIGGAGHSIWDSVYKDPQVFNWLLTNSRP